MVPHLKIFIVAIIIFLVFIYVQYYSKYNKDIKIIQLDLDKINGDILMEKYPIIIYDRIIKPKDLLKTLFAYSYNIKHENVVLFNDRLVWNTSKYVVLFNQISDCDVNVIHPKCKKLIAFDKRNKNNGLILSQARFGDMTENVEYVTIKLKKNQVMILPTFWIYHSPSPLQSFNLHDYFSYIYEKFL
jgi:hypothetical protein